MAQKATRISGQTPQSSIGERREASLMLALIFLMGLAGALLLTLSGMHALMQLVNAANDFKSGLIASVLGLGLVVLGPVLLLALTMMLPRWWFNGVKRRIKNMFRAHAH